jgi:hypothetical protein
LGQLRQLKQKRGEPLFHDGLKSFGALGRQLYKSVVVFTLISSAASAAEYFVSPNASSGGDGSQARPWTLAAALAQPPAVRPGDTIWLRGGVYRGSFTSNLTGATSAPIKVQSYPGEQATIDGVTAPESNTLTIRGSNAWYIDFVVTNSTTVRSVPARAHEDYTPRGIGVVVLGANVKCINLIVRETGQGFEFQTTSVNSELYGNILYNNGYIAPDRQHGHGIYVQNSDGTKLIRDNVLFHQYGLGMHGYGVSAKLNNLNIEGNIHFRDRFLVGGPPVLNLRLASNLFYDSDVALGYGLQYGNSGAAISGNTFAKSPLWLNWWKDAVVSGNYFYAPDGDGANVILRVTPGAVASQNRFSSNTYQQARRDGDFALYSSSNTMQRLTFPLWQAALLEAGSNYLTSSNIRPTSNQIVVRPNAYEQGRGHVVIYNWTLAPSVDVDVSSLGLAPGDTITLRNVQDFERDVIRMTYTGAPLRISMHARSVSTPVGGTGPLHPTSFPEFGAFLVRKENVGTNAPQAPGIGNLQVSNVRGRSAMVSVTSATATTAQLEFGKTTQYGSVLTSGTRANTHVFSLQNLEEGTTYSLRATVTNEGGASESTLGTLTTLDETAPAATSQTATDLTSTSATVRWSLSEPGSVQVEYGPANLATTTTSASALASTGNVALPNLSPSTTYRFRLVMRDAAGNSSVSAFQTFATAAAPTGGSGTGTGTGTGTPVDRTAPVISAVAVANSGATSVVVVWSTNEVTSGQVEFGTSTSFGRNVLTSSAGTRHQVSLTSLAAGTLYYVRVQATDATGNSAYSATQTFRTPQPTSSGAVTILNARIMNITNRDAQVAWNTNVPATAQVEYGVEGGSSLGTLRDGDPATSHLQRLVSLRPNTTYYVRILSRTASGAQAEHPKMTFTTPAN